MINDETYWKSEFLVALEYEGITDINFFNYLKENDKRVKRYRIPFNALGWGVFPKIDKDGILRDIRILVPEIVDEKTLCINIHEYVHAYEMYYQIGEVYEWHVKESEEKAVKAEHNYLMLHRTTK